MRSLVTVFGSKFRGNMAIEGGALYLDASLLHCDSSEFSYNSAFLNVTKPVTPITVALKALGSSAYAQIIPVGMETGVRFT